jgi:hypothetical protein
MCVKLFVLRRNPYMDNLGIAADECLENHSNHLWHLADRHQSWLQGLCPLFLLGLRCCHVCHGRCIPLHDHGPTPSPFPRSNSPALPPLHGCEMLKGCSPLGCLLSTRRSPPRPQWFTTWAAPCTERGSTTLSAPGTAGRSAMRTWPRYGISPCCVPHSLFSRFHKCGGKSTLGMEFSRCHFWHDSLSACDHGLVCRIEIVIVVVVDNDGCAIKLWGPSRQKPNAFPPYLPTYLPAYLPTSPPLKHLSRQLHVLCS